MADTSTPRMSRLLEAVTRAVGPTASRNLLPEYFAIQEMPTKSVAEEYLKNRPKVPDQAPWMRSRSEGLRTAPPLTFGRGGLWLNRPTDVDVQRFMEEGATDEQIESKYPNVFWPWQLKALRLRLNESIRKRQKVRRPIRR